MPDAPQGLVNLGIIAFVTAITDFILAGFYLWQADRNGINLQNIFGLGPAPAGPAGSPPATALPGMGRKRDT